MRYGVKGPTYCTVSACASPAHSVGEALELIRNDRADIMIAGGAEAAITPLAVASFANMKALSERNDDPATASRPFDKDRDGFVLGDGAAVLTLEEGEHARPRGAKIYAELAGVGMTADAYHITAPSPAGSGAPPCPPGWGWGDTTPPWGGGGGREQGGTATPRPPPQRSKGRAGGGGGR